MRIYALGVEQFEIMDQRLGRMLEAMHVVPMTFAKALGSMIVNEARSMLGVAQPGVAGPMGVYPPWPPNLASETMRRRAARGINSADQPLLESGAMRDSIAASPPMYFEDGVVFIVGYRPIMGGPGKSRPGSIAYPALHEIGTSRMPARPVLGPAVIRVSENIKDVLGPIAFNHFNILAGGGLQTFFASAPVRG